MTGAATQDRCPSTPRLPVEKPKEKQEWLQQAKQQKVALEAKQLPDISIPHHGSSSTNKLSNDEKTSHKEIEMFFLCLV